jgi:hypothetical protein
MWDKIGNKSIIGLGHSILVIKYIIYIAITTCSDTYSLSALIKRTIAK